MAASRHLGFLKFESCTIKSADPENTTLEPNIMSLCTPCPEKKSLEYFRHNFIKYWPIFKIRSLLQSAEYLQ